MGISLRHMLAAGTLALLTAVILLAAPPLVHPGIEPAHARSCSGANALPGEITARKARNNVICLINKKRAKRDQHRLDKTRSLNKAARDHSKYMEQHSCFAHQCLGELGLLGRILDTAYLPCNCSWGIGENVGWGSDRLGTPRQIVRAWMRSDRHRANILNGDFRDIGVGVVRGTPSDPNANGGIYTADFGYKR